MKRDRAGVGGPKTRLGRARSSRNAAKHGLGALGLLVKGERPCDYRAHLEAWLDALKPKNAAEVQIIAVLADLCWRQQRWFAVERGNTEQEIEMNVAKTDTMKNFSLDVRSLTAVNALVRAVDCGRPTTSKALEPFIDAAEKTIAIIEEGNGPVAPVERLRAALRRLTRDRDQDGWESLFDDVGQRGRELAAELSGRVSSGEQALSDLRATLTATALPAERDLKKLGRYQATLQRAIEAQTRILSEVRREVRKTEKGTRRTSSFGAASPTVRLRVVR